MKKPVRTGNLKFVRHGDVERHHLMGWLVVQADLGPTHGHWSVLMWRCDCWGAE